MVGMSEADIRAERVKKLDILKEAGMEAYPARTSATATIAEFLANFDERMNGGKATTLAGRVMSIRGQGGIMFADIFDGSTSLTTGGTGRGQVVFQQSEMSAASFELFGKAVDAGDFIEVTGVAFKTQRGHQSLKATSWRMLSKSLLPIPDQWYGLKDEELVLRQRYLDILLNEDVRKMFERKAKFWRSIREFYLARGFLEVETPVLETMPGGADARPFKTHHNALDIDVYLRISAGELWQKELLIAGFPKVFEIGRIFRNEGQSREHLQDYTQLESYEAFSDVQAGMKFVQELYRHVAKEVYGQYTFTIGTHTVDLAEDWPIIDFSEAIKKEFGIDPISCSEKDAIQAVRDAKINPPTGGGETLNKARAVDHLWKHIRKSISGPAFLTGVPIFLEPLAKRSSHNPEIVERIQVLLAGSEVGKGYSELNDPQDQRTRFEEQQKLRDAGDDEAQRLDTEYVRAMEYGMPPAFGFGVSERLFAFLENRPAHETQLFPLLRPKT
jgi:lysyl-tRNA synthetase class 2